jgi:hypothetical protein
LPYIEVVLSFFKNLGRNIGTKKKKRRRTTTTTTKSQLNFKKKNKKYE